MAVKTVIRAGHPKLEKSNKKIANINLPKIKKIAQRFDRDN